MKDIRDCGLDILIKQASDKVYVGTSAGAIIMTPQIDLASDEKHGMTDFKGLGLVNFYLKPHWNRYTVEEQTSFLEYGARVYGTTPYHIDDGEALIVNNGIPKYISLKS